MSDALPLQEQKSKIEFAKRLPDALRHCGDNPDYEVLDNLCRSVLSGSSTFKPSTRIFFDVTALGYSDEE